MKPTITVHIMAQKIPKADIKKIQQITAFQLWLMQMVPLRSIVA